jgi:putative ABC transport system permease protein
VLATALLVGAVYSGLIAERRHELGLLLAVGMRPVQVVRLILAEAVLATGLGGTCGVLIGVAVLFSIRRSLGFVFEAQRIPFALPDAFALAAIGAVSVALYCGIGLIGSMVPAWRVSRSEPYALIRREGP